MWQTGPGLGGFLLALAITSGAVSAQDAGDATHGAEIFRQCAACHQIGAGALNRIGPQLNSVFGRQAGSLSDFRYSEGLVRAGVDGIIWTRDTLDICEKAYIVGEGRIIAAGTTDDVLNNEHVRQVYLGEQFRM